MRKQISTLAAVLLITFSSCLHAVTPQQCIVLVNKDSEASQRIAHFFAKKYNLKPEQLIFIQIEDAYDKWKLTISPQMFSERIFQPCKEHLKREGLEKSTLLWIYSADFPIKVTGDSITSIHGYTMLNGCLPTKDIIQYGRFASTYYDAPITPEQPLHMASPITKMKNGCILSCSLGYRRMRGNSEAEIIQSLNQPPMPINKKLPIAILKSGNIRSTCRTWQYTEALKTFHAEGISTKIISSNFKDNTPPNSGIQMGAQSIHPKLLTSIATNSIADNLTSYGAAFDAPEQTKITEWMRHGASFSIGTVTEPYAIWTKFPHIAIQYFYEKGLTAIDASYRAVASPLQTYFLGNPFALKYGAVTTKN